MSSFKITKITRSHEKSLNAFSTEEAEKVRRFHKTFPMYCPTPLVSLHDTAAFLGLGGIYVKDESKRFDLNAFKVLGGSYAVGRILAKLLNMDSVDLDYGILTSEENKTTLRDITLITATDGNHGRGVAWSAARFGMKSVVYLPKGTAKERLDNILALGADAKITDLNYDDTVRLAARHAKEKGWILVQDTGSDETPTHIMQGYSTMALEAIEQLPEKPTHIFLQAGVGSMAGAVAAVFASYYGENRPTIVVIEPNNADCIYRTAEADDGKLHFVTGELNTIMAGLACGEPCELAWELLRECADYCISCPDYAAAAGMRMLGNPAGSDERIISGESGASSFGCVARIMTEPSLAPIRSTLGLDRTSRVLFFSTEGATDRENYRAVVWDGKIPCPETV